MKSIKVFDSRSTERCTDLIACSGYVQIAINILYFGRSRLGTRFRSEGALGGDLYGANRQYIEQL